MKKSMKRRSNLLHIAILIVFISFIISVGQNKHSIGNMWNRKACLHLSDSLSIDYINRSLSIIDDNPVFWSNKGLILSHADSLFPESVICQNFDSCFYSDSAYHCLSRAFMIEDRDWVFCLNYAISFLTLDINNNKDKVKEILSDFAKKYDVDLPYLGFLGMMEEADNNDSMAINYYSEMIVRSPTVTESRFYLDLINRNKSIADCVIEKALKILMSDTCAYDNPVILSKMAVLRMWEHNYDEAEMMLRHAVEVMPTMNRAWYHLGILAEMSRNLSLAKDYYIMSIKMDCMDPLPIERVSLIDEKYLDYYEETMGEYESEIAQVLEHRYGSASMKQSFVILDWERYFDPLSSVIPGQIDKFGK